MIITSNFGPDQFCSRLLSPNEPPWFSLGRAAEGFSVVLPFHAAQKGVNNVAVVAIRLSERIKRSPIALDRRTTIDEVGR